MKVVASASIVKAPQLNFGIYTRLTWCFRVWTKNLILLGPIKYDVVVWFGARCVCMGKSRQTSTSRPTRTSYVIVETPYPVFYFCIIATNQLNLVVRAFTEYQLQAISPATVLILDSRFGGTHIWGGKFDAFFNVFFCILGVFLGGGFGILGGIPPPGDSWK